MYFSVGSSSSERIIVESICKLDCKLDCNFDVTLPLPAEVEAEFREKAGDNLTALAWLTDHGIDSAPTDVALIQYGMVWNPETGRYQFMIYAPDHVGPKHAPELAIPIIEDGIFVDLLFISDEMSFARATCRTPWLGRENLPAPVTGSVVRLYAHPMDWLESGGTGVCHIEPISRKALKDLRSVGTIECNDIHTALETWDWAFDADRECLDSEQELSRFIIDDSPFAIRCYFEDEVRWRTRHLARTLS
jgi:hypothetical protein